MLDSRKCSICLRDKPTAGAVLKGKFGRYCPKCMAEQNRLDGVQKASYDRDRDREDHRKDMLQPWLSNGKPNREFIQAYPEESKGNFTEEEIKEYS